MRLGIGLAISLLLLTPAAPAWAAPPAEAPAASADEPRRGFLGVFGRRRPKPPAEPAQSRQPPQPPQPPAPPAIREPKRFFVYMPFDRLALTPDGAAAVDEAAAYAKAGQATRIRLTGHTDTSGQATYNLGQSERYARMVAAALADRGVARAILQLDWKGEAELAVPTPDNFREPGNRRVTIDLEF